MLLAVLLTACVDPPANQPDSVASCPTGELLDGEACVPDACGVGPWGALQVDSDTVYVDATAAGTGDGSEAAPLTSVQAGVDLAGDRGGALVAVAAGTYPEVVGMDDVDNGVTLAGRCRELVIIDGSEGDSVPAIEIVGARKTVGVAIQGLTVMGGTAGGVRVEHAKVSMIASDVRENTLVGLNAVNAELSLDDVGVYSTAPDKHGNFGRGINAQSGAWLTATDCTVQENTEVGIYVGGAGTAAELVDTSVLDTSTSPDGTGGRGAVAEEGAALTITGSLIRGNTGLGVYGTGPGTTIELAATSILDTSPPPGDDPGSGIAIETGATLTANGCTIQGNSGVGVFVAGAGAVADLVDTGILDTRPSPDGRYGVGAWVELGAALTGSRCTVEGNTGDGVFASGVGSTVALQDTAVLNTLSGPDGTTGAGVWVEGGATLSAQRCVVQGNTEVGVLARSAGALVDLADSQILDTQPIADGTVGLGIAVQDGAMLSATGCTVQGNSEFGVLASDAATVVELTDTDVLDTSPSRDGTFGRGIGVSSGATLTATRCTIQGNTDLGLAVAEAGTSVALVDTEILNTAAGPDGSGGGLWVSSGANLTATGCSFRENTGTGVWVNEAGTTVDLVDCEVLDTLPGPGDGVGRGIVVSHGAALTGTGCTVQGNTEVGLLADGEGSSSYLADSSVLGTRRGRTAAAAFGAVAQAGAVVRLSESDVSETEGPGVLGTAGGRMELDGVELSENSFAGAMVVAGSIVLRACTIEGTLSDPEWGGGFGVYATAAFGPSTLALADTTVGTHAYAAVWLDGNGTFDLERNQLSGGAGVDQNGATLHGNAVFAENGVTAWDGNTGLLLADNAITGSVAIGVLLDGSSASLIGNSWSTNGTDLRQQACEGVVPLTAGDVLGVPKALVCPTGNVLTAYDLQFSTLLLPTSETAD